MIISTSYTEVILIFPVLLSYKCGIQDGLTQSDMLTANLTAADSESGMKDNQSTQPNTAASREATST